MTESFSIVFAEQLTSLTGILLLMFFPCVSLGAELATDAPGDTEAVSPAADIDIDWREIRKCGPNSLYLLLTVNGHQVQYDDLIDETLITEKGVSVAELKRVAAKFGMPLRAWQVSPEQLASMSLPAIIHLESDWQGQGHYVVLQTVNADQSCVVIDATRGSVSRLTHGELFDRWGGVLLGVDAPIDHSPWQAILTVSAVCLGLLCCVAGISLRQTTESALHNDRHVAG